LGKGDEKGRTLYCVFFVFMGAEKKNPKGKSDREKNRSA